MVWISHTIFARSISSADDFLIWQALARFEARYSDLETIVETAWRSRAQTGRGHHTGIPTPLTPS